jgi:hypothetical protein
MIVFGMIRTAAALLSAAGMLAAVHPCQSCHPVQTKNFLGSPMGRALSEPSGGESGEFVHAVSGSRFTIRANGAAAIHKLERNGIVAEHSIAYRIGSGNHATGYLVRTGDALFQSPVAFYNRRGVWDVAPGYEANPRPDFNRRITDDCLSCHSNGRLDAPEAISCERCHGLTAEHLRRPVRSTILNPVRLAIAQRDSVCEQCHLSGETRVASPGKSLTSFQVGQTLEENFSVFVYDQPRNDLRVVSHAEQLALSRCARETEGKLWCGSCHAPHGEKVDVTTKCRSCHGGRLPASHASRTECVSCHMPKRQAVDGGHTAFTDHRIGLGLETLVEARGERRLRPWRAGREAAVDARNFGLAEIIVGEKDGSASLINSGYRKLQSVFPRFERDADVLASLGMVLFLKDQTNDALKLMSAAVAARPNDAALQEKLAVVQRGSEDLTRARESLERAITLDPLAETAYHLLADLQPSAELRRSVLERYLKVNPQSVLAREAIRDSTRR